MTTFCVVSEINGGKFPNDVKDIAVISLMSGLVTAAWVCPACKGWAVGKKETETRLLKTGRCQACSAILFTVHGP
jgi:hypothetical protein